MAGSDSRNTPINYRYYNAVGVHHTTTSCGSVAVKRRCRQTAWPIAVALIGCLSSIAVNTVDDTNRGSSPLFPLSIGWTTHLADAPSNVPAYDETHVYVPLRDNTLVAIALDTGDVHWSIGQPTEHAPVASQGVLIVAQDRKVVGLRAADAQRLWTADVGATVSAPFALTSGWLVVPLTNGELVTLRGLDGHELWRRQLNGPLHVRPSIAGNQLFVPIADGRITVLDLRTGELLWERRLDGSPQEILPLDALFVGSTDNYFYCLSRQHGEITWRWRTGGDIVGRASVDENRVYFLSLDNLFRALDRDNGAQQWRRPLKGRPIAGPVKVAHLWLVAGVSPELLLFDAVTGQNAGSFLAPGELAAPPHIVPNLPVTGTRVVVLTGDGRLVGLSAGTGPRQFKLTFPPAPLLPRPERLTLPDVLPLVPIILKR